MISLPAKRKSSGIDADPPVARDRHRFPWFTGQEFVLRADGSVMRAEDDDVSDAVAGILRGEGITVLTSATPVWAGPVACGWPCALRTVSGSWKVHTCCRPSAASLRGPRQRRRRDHDHGPGRHAGQAHPTDLANAIFTHPLPAEGRNTLFSLFDE